MEAFLLCVLWILYAKRPLLPKEFYHALWSGLSMKDLVDDQIPDVTHTDTSESIDKFSRYVISSSKGLAEVTKSQQPTVQFIHESVRDFLIKHNGLHELWPDLGFDWESPSHERLKQCCSFYMNHTLVCASIEKLQLERRSDCRTITSMNYPFLEYTSQHILYHSNAAAKLVLQDKFLSAFPLLHFTRVHNAFETFEIRKYGPDASLLYILADKGLPKLIRTWLKEDPHIHVLGERYRYPLFASLANGHKDTVAAILGLPSSMYNSVDISEELNGKREYKEYENRTPLSWAAQDGRASIVKLLLQTRITLDVLDEGGRTALSRSSSNGHEAVVRLLIGGGAKVDTGDKDGWTPI
ncbi:hypothetical protein N7504_004978 [Penicillium tannophilum]|nr:hypothetical protein N7504_004978 [Penicillium tannophilum]